MTDVFLRSADGLRAFDEAYVPPVAALDPRALALSGISLSFGGIHALKDVTLEVRPGEIRAVIGPNGAGKSSLINVISGLYQPDAGQIILNGHRLSRVRPQALAGLGVARSFQNLALFPGLTVAQNIAAGLIHGRKSGLLAQVLRLPGARAEAEDVAAKVQAVAAELGLEPLLGQLVAGLPYGAQKQVELARALVAEPKLLLLDEPMAGLTASEKQDMAAHIRAARDRLGLAVVLIEHDIGVVMGLSDRVAVLDHGIKIADGTPAEVQSNREVIAAYLGEAA